MEQCTKGTKHCWQMVWGDEYREGRRKEWFVEIHVGSQEGGVRCDILSYPGKNISGGIKRGGSSTNSTGVRVCH